MTENPDKRIELAKELIESLRVLIEKSREIKSHPVFAVPGLRWTGDKRENWQPLKEETLFEDCLAYETLKQVNLVVGSVKIA